MRRHQFRRLILTHNGWNQFMKFLQRKNRQKVIWRNKRLLGRSIVYQSFNLNKR